MSYVQCLILLRADISQMGLVVSMHVYLCTDLYNGIHFTPEVEPSLTSV